MRFLVALSLFMSVWLHHTVAFTYNAPNNCEWSFRDPTNQDVSLVCNLRTISSDLDSSSLSLSQAEHTKQLSVLCSDVLFFQSSLQSRIFQRFYNLDSLSIEYCKLTSLPSGTFLGLDVLKKLTVTTHNSDWSIMALDLESESLVGMPHLEYLQLGKNNIWTLPERVFCPLPALRHLNLTWNRLQDVSEVGVTGGCGAHLITLDLSGNDLVMLPEAGLAGLESLKELYLQYNDISMMADAALVGLNSLNILNMSSNRLVALPPEIFNETLSLQELYIHNNSLSVLAPGLFSSLTHLTLLDLSHNKLTSEWVNGETFKGLLRLVVLNLSHNKVNQVGEDMFHDMSALQVLDLSNNDLTSIGDLTFSALVNLHRLDLSYNRLATMGSRSLAGLHVLSSLSLSHNNLTSIAPSALENCTSLRNLRFEFNFLKEIPLAVSEATSLRTLRLSHNLLTEIREENLTKLKNLQHLDLSNNVLRTLCKECLSGLGDVEVLDLSMNELTAIPHNSFDTNQGLKLIRLDGNKISDVNALFAALPNLIWLNVSDNRIAWFDYALIPAQLEYLDLQHNRITELGNYFTIQKQLQLKTLDASHNSIEKLGPTSVPDSIQLLFVNSNKITEIASGTFSEKLNISMVDLYDNLLTKIDLTSIHLSHVPEEQELPQFYIGGNPIFCDCNMEWMHRVHQISARRQHPRVMDLDKVTCTLPYPRSNENRISFLETRPSQFLCPYSSHCFALCQCCDFIACDCQMTCPTGCSCYHDDTWATNIVDCSARGHHQLPDDIPMDATIVYMDANEMNVLDAHHLIGRKNLRKLFLNESRIESIQNRTFHGLSSLKELYLHDNHLVNLIGYEFEFLVNLRYLNLQNNRLKYIGNDTFAGLVALEVLLLQGNFIVDFPVWNLNANKVLREVGLANNRWSCDCQYLVDFKTWLNRYKDIALDAKTLHCISNKTNEPGPLVVETSYSCENFVATSIVQEKIHNNFLEPILITLGLFFLVFILCVAFVVLRVRLQKVVSKKCGLKLFPPEPTAIAKEDDKTIIYDAFISHSDLDSKFVNDTISRELENAEPPYKLILSSRDYETVGNYVGDFIVHSIESSRRTVLIVSKNFLDNDWCKFSFKAAHLEALKTYKNRIVVVMIGEVTENDFDSELSSIVKGAPSLHFEDKTFWSKLHAALPASPPKPSAPDCFINETNYVTRNNVPGLTPSHTIKPTALGPTMVLNNTNINNSASLPHHHHLHHHHHHHHPLPQRSDTMMHQHQTQTSIGSDTGELDKTFASGETAQSSLAPSLSPSVAPSLSHSYMSIDYATSSTATRTSHIYASIDEPITQNSQYPNTSVAAVHTRSQYQPLHQPLHQQLHSASIRRGPVLQYHGPSDAEVSRQLLQNSPQHLPPNAYFQNNNRNPNLQFPNQRPDIPAVPASYFI
uniref:Toll family protein LongTollB n=1 Tax=Parhyale hawaiensis TaxID=317513 RepID=A0A173ADV5_9CRUS|nr:toll family protein LongTollB [Parhyale hawaiensis]